MENSVSTTTTTKQWTNYHDLTSYNVANEEFDCFTWHYDQSKHNARLLALYDVMRAVNLITQQ